VAKSNTDLELLPRTERQVPDTALGKRVQHACRNAPQPGERKLLITPESRRVMGFENRAGFRSVRLYERHVLKLLLGSVAQCLSRLYLAMAATRSGICESFFLTTKNSSTEQGSEVARWIMAFGKASIMIHAIFKFHDGNSLSDIRVILYVLLCAEWLLWVPALVLIPLVRMLHGDRMALPHRWGRRLAESYAWHGITANYHSGSRQALQTDLQHAAAQSDRLGNRCDHDDTWMNATHF